jgi:myo-inositol catabolism protein IolS
MALQAEGKIKHIGVSNFGVEQLQEALKTKVHISYNQLAYNLLFRAIEFEILPLCKELGIEVVAYSPL